MKQRKRFSLKGISRRWLRDASSKECSFVPLDKAPPSRSRDGFELRANGTYCDMGNNPLDAGQDAEGTWSADDDGVVTLSRTAISPYERKLRLDEADEDRLLVESVEAASQIKVILFDLGNTLESNDVLLTGAEETLKAIQQMTGPPGVQIELALLSDWKMPNDERELEAFKQEYYDLLSRLGIRGLFEPVAKYVTLSTEVGVGKPDPTLFRAAVDKIAMGTSFENVFFVTENAEHVAAARELGMRAVQFKAPGQAHGEVAALRDLLPLIREFVAT